MTEVLGQHHKDGMRTEDFSGWRQGGQRGSPTPTVQEKGGGLPLRRWRGEGVVGGDCIRCRCVCAGPRLDMQRDGGVGAEAAL